MPPGFTMLDDAAILRSREVGSTVFQVYAAIAQHVREDRKAWPGIGRLAEITGLSPRWVRHAIRCLESSGWLRVERCKGHGNIYVLPLIESREPQFPTPEISKEPQFPTVRNPSSSGKEVQFPRVRNPSSPEGNHRRKPIRKPVKETKRGCAAEVVLPSELDCDSFREAWERWLSYRRKRRLSCLPECLEGQLKKLAALGATGAVEEIENAITNTWQSVCYKPGGNRNGRQRTVGAGQRNAADSHHEDGVL
jgi:hypothetical protein